MSKRIVWLQDNPLMGVSSSGAENNDLGKIKEGIRRGYDITVVTPMNFSKTAVESADLVVMSNVHHFTKEQLTFSAPYVIYHHDYSFICRWRLYYPGDDRCLKCSYDPWRKELMEKAKLNIFLSDLHRKAHQLVVPSLNMENSKCVPSSVDTEFFRPRGLGKPDSYVHLGVLDDFKGIENILDYADANKIKVDFYGPEQNQRLCDEIEARGHKVLGPVDYHDLPGVYSKYEYAVHLPSNIEPYGRFCVEAYLCGLKVVTNSKNGAWSYPFMKEGRDVARGVLASASAAFWEELEKEVLKK